MEFFAGIGSRETPSSVLALMSDASQVAAAKGWGLRTGNAVGADQACAAGVNRVNPAQVELILPWPSYEKQAIVPGNVVITEEDEDWYILAAKFHPKWDILKPSVKKLHSRNIGIIGTTKPVKQVVCYLNHSKPGGGGTGQAVRYAQYLGIEVIDMATREGLERIIKMIKKDIDKTLKGNT